MHMTDFSTEHLATFGLACQACGLQETRLTEAAHSWAREVMKEIKMENRVCSAIGSVALCLGCETRCGVTESTVDNTTRECTVYDGTLRQCPGLALISQATAPTTGGRARSLAWFPY